MTASEPKPQIKTFSTCVLPWLAAAVMLGVFLMTMNRWVTPASLNQIAEINQWANIPTIFGPVTYLVTFPLQLLPQDLVPLALNLFSALCGAVVLGSLARSVAILPHDRTLEQRDRADNDLFLLTTRTAWMPPLFAVIVCGLQMTFWENATEGTARMFDLVLFACSIRCLLEYRISQREAWLYRFAVIYGLGMANGWGMVGFFPLFLGAVIWIKGLGFFRPRFLIRLFGFGLAGFSLFFLVPILIAIRHSFHIGYWKAIEMALVHDKRMLWFLPHDVVLLLALMCILPICVVGIRWANYFDANTPFGIFIGKSVFHIAYAALLFVCIWVALDCPVSPRNKGMGISTYLSLYYLDALCVGYFTGYFLLIFGKNPVKPASSSFPPLISPSLARVGSYIIIGCVGLLFVALPLVMARRNLPFLLRKQATFRAYDHYAAQIDRLLPTNGAVVLGDDTPSLFYLKAKLVRDGTASRYLLVESAALATDPDYLSFLRKHNPQFEISTDWNKVPSNASPSFGAIQTLRHFASSHELVYVHPSVGDYFEEFYPEADGLIYHLRPYPTNVWDAPLPTQEQIAKNEAFWNTEKQFFPALTNLMTPPTLSPKKSKWDAFLKKLRLKKEQDPLPFVLGRWYSRALNFFGVELQKSGQLTNASRYFEQAVALNPGNAAARINLGFNGMLATNGEMSVDAGLDLEDRMPRGWMEILNSDGPIDEPNCRDKIASLFAKGGDLRQAVQQLDRIKEVSPNSLRVPLQLAELMHYIRYSARGSAVLLPYSEGTAEALTNLDEVLQRRPNDPYTLLLKGAALIELKQYKEAIQPLNRLLFLQTNNYVARVNRGLAYLKSGNLEAAKKDYETVIAVLPKVYQAYYNLGEIGYEQKDKPAAIKNYELYLSNAPTNTAEAKFVRDRLAALKKETQ